jgi:hypothetical protein
VRALGVCFTVNFLVCLQQNEQLPILANTRSVKTLHQAAREGKSGAVAALLAVRLKDLENIKIDKTYEVTQAKYAFTFPL